MSQVKEKIPFSVRMPETFMELFIVLGLLGLVVYHSGMVGVFEASLLDLFLILGVSALWIYATKRLKAQDSLAGDILKLTYIYCAVHVSMGIASCIDPYGESAFSGILYLLFFAIGFAFHIVFLKTYSGKIRRYCFSWIAFAVLCISVSLFYPAPVEPDLPLDMETELTDYHIPTLEEIHNASAAEDLSGMVLSIQLFAQAVAFIFFIFALTEGGSDEAKSKKRKYIALAVSIVSAILMEVVYKLA